MARSQRIEFIGAQGETLAARLDLPDGPVRAYALFAHCFSCSKDTHAAHRVSRRLAQQGFGVLRFDFTGLGQSDGDFANTNFSSNIADLVAAAGWLEREREAPQLLVGHSLGGAAVLVAAGDLPQVKAVAVLGAPADAGHVVKQFEAQVDEIERSGEAEVSLAGRPFRIRKQFLDDIAEQKVEAAAKALKRPLLIAHSPIDETVGIDNATRLFIAARHPKSFVSLDHADHLLSQPEDAAYIADVIAAWAGRYAGAATAADAPSDAKAVEVAETGDGRYENRVRVRTHSLLADEPESVGGGDTGPNPYEYLAAALGACTSMTLRMYAQRKGWPLERVAVTLHHEKGHADDCADCVEGDSRKVDIFERQLVIEGDLDAEQRQRLVEIADKCPVHQTLHNPVVVRTQLVEAAAQET
jgi:putative redox protein